MSIRSESCCKGNRHEHNRKKKRGEGKLEEGKEEERKEEKEYEEIRYNRPVERVTWKQKGEKQGTCIPQNKIDGEAFFR